MGHEGIKNGGSVRSVGPGQLLQFVAEAGHIDGGGHRPGGGKGLEQIEPKENKKNAGRG